MRFIVSPAKKMNVVDDSLPCNGTPQFLARTQQLAEAMRALNYEQAKALWRCSDALAQLNFDRFHVMDIQAGTLTPALLAYEGIQYQHMAPHVMQDDQLEYLQTHLRILSGFYGVLRPFDGVVPYRLEMQAKLSVDSHPNLYDFWGNSLFDALSRETDLIINLASVEYAKAVLPYAESATKKQEGSACTESASSQKGRNGGGRVDLPDQPSKATKPEGSASASSPRILTCLFGTLNNEGRLIQRSTAAKAARGSMVRWCAENQVQAAEELKQFNAATYYFDPTLSSANNFVFVEHSL